MIYLDRWMKDKIGGEIEEYQLSNLKKMVSYVSEKSVFYKNLADYDIKDLDDLSKLAFTYPDDLKRESYKLLCVSLSQIKRVFTLFTSGTTGTPKRVFFTEADLDQITDYMGAASRTVAECGGLSEGYIALQLIPDGKPASQAELSSQGARKVKAVPITASPLLDSESLVQIIKKHHPDILFGSPTRVYRLTQQTKEQHNLDRLGVKILFLSSEYVPKAMRERLQDIWGCEVYQYYGMTEMGFVGGVECHAHIGYHLSELDLLLEVVDPETGESVKEGQGELVFTTLRREAMPLIRYRTGDLVELITEGCPCGTSLKTIGKTIRRVGEVEKLGDKEISLITFDDVLYVVPEVIDYQVALTREGGKDRVIIRAQVTHKEKVVDKIKDLIMSIPPIRESIEAERMSEPKIELVDSIKREGRAKKRIERF